MKLLKIQAENMREAMSEARRLLGDDAVILHSRKCEIGPGPGVAVKQGVEILAGSDSATEASTTQSGVATSDGAEVKNLEHQVESLRSTLSDLLAGSAATAQPKVSPVVERLVKSGVSESIAKAAVGDCTSADEAVRAVASRFRTQQPDLASGQVRLALVGPTGVGKTTTAAKLAAQYALFEGKSVALVTLDTYRVGAVEQLSTFARLLDIPMEVAFSPEDGDALIAKHADKDVIIIDTVGRSQRNREHIAELGRFLQVARPTEVHLAISASTGRAAQLEAVDSFGPLGVRTLILTKLDECPEPGCALELAMRSMLPFSFVTYGQDVPDDIAPAESKGLTRFVWEGRL